MGLVRQEGLFRGGSLFKDHSCRYSLNDDKMRERSVLQLHCSHIVTSAICNDPHLSVETVSQMAPLPSALLYFRRKLRSGWVASSLHRFYCSYEFALAPASLHALIPNSKYVSALCFTICKGVVDELKFRILYTISHDRQNCILAADTVSTPVFLQTFRACEAMDWHQKFEQSGHAPP